MKEKMTEIINKGKSLVAENPEAFKIAGAVAVTLTFVGATALLARKLELFKDVLPGNSSEVIEGILPDNSVG